MENPIKMFFHCRLCADEAPGGISMSEFQKIEAGFDQNRNVVIWCKRHEEPITILLPEKK